LNPNYSTDDSFFIKQKQSRAADYAEFSLSTLSVAYGKTLSLKWLVSKEQDGMKK